MEPKFERLAEIFKNPEEAQMLMALAPDEAVKVLMERYQLDFSVDELNEVAAGIRAAMKEDSVDELTSEDLETVTGGRSGAYTAGYYIGKTVKVVGVGVGIAGGLVALGIVSW